MLDTIKLGIPLTRAQHEKITRLASQNDCWQWVLLNPSSGELLFRRTKGIANTDGESFHRQLRWDIPHVYEEDCYLTLEFSVPKYWYGHNVHLLYNWFTPLNCLRDLLNQQFGLKGKGKLAEVSSWKVLRADVCYAWRFPHQKLAQRFLDSLKRLHFPRKRPIIYDDSILFVGKTYSLKFYLKLPEFRAHDRKELLKVNAAMEWIEYCEQLADGVLRVEATLRRQYLKRKGINTVADLVEQVAWIEWHDSTQHPYQPSISVDSFLRFQEKSGKRIEDGVSLTMPPVQIGYLDENGELQAYPHPGGDFTFRKCDRTAQILNFLLVKFVGENAGMQRADQVKTKLLEVYKPVKAARLVSFWLYVQKFGSAESKEIFGRDSYYYSVRELKKAGITLIEPPSGSNVTVMDRDFIQQFKMEIPSQFVTNKVDDFRDSGNVLNFVPRTSEENAS